MDNLLIYQKQGTIVDPGIIQTQHFNPLFYAANIIFSYI